MQQDYMVRPITINTMYKEGIGCKYEDDNGSHEHALWEPLNFADNELSVYSQNDLMGKIKDKVFNYKDLDLTLNSFKLHYKPYSLWSENCQGTYTTEDFSVLGVITGDVSDYAVGCIAMSII
jgi:hypothetical protein